MSDIIDLPFEFPEIKVEEPKKIAIEETPKDTINIPFEFIPKGLNNPDVQVIEKQSEKDVINVPYLEAPSIDNTSLQPKDIAFGEVMAYIRDNTQSKDDTPHWFTRDAKAIGASVQTTLGGINQIFRMASDILEESKANDLRNFQNVGATWQHDLSTSTGEFGNILLTPTEAQILRNDGISIPRDLQLNVDFLHKSQLTDEMFNKIDPAKLDWFKGISSRSTEDTISALRSEFSSLSQSFTYNSKYWSEQVRKSWTAQPKPELDKKLLAAIQPIVEQNFDKPKVMYKELERTLGTALWRQHPLARFQEVTLQSLIPWVASLTVTGATKNPTMGAAFLGGLQSAGTYENAKDAGVSTKDALIYSAMDGAMATLTEYVPLEFMLKPLGVNRALKIIASGSLEGIQELGSQIYSNMIQQYGWDEGTKLMDNWLEALAGGIGLGIVGDYALNPTNRINIPSPTNTQKSSTLGRLRLLDPNAFEKNPDGTFKLKDGVELTRDRALWLLVNSSKMNYLQAEMSLRIVDFWSRAQGITEQEGLNIVFKNFGKDPENTTKQKVIEVYQSVFHGSKYVFSTFDTSKIGTGQGMQNFGWGIYVAERQEVAKGIEKQLSSIEDIIWKKADNIISYQNGNINEEAPIVGDIFTKLRMYGSADSLEKVLQREIEEKSEDSTSKPYLEEQVKWLSLNKNNIEIKTSGHLYQADIPIENQKKFLFWDKSIAQQSLFTQKALAPLLNEIKSVYKNRGFDTEKYLNQLNHLNNTITGSELYELLTEIRGGQKEASLSLLNDYGILGTKYLDQGSRIIDNYFKFDKSTNTWSYTSPGTYETYTAKSKEKIIEGLKERKQTYNYVIYDPKQGISDLKMLNQSGIDVHGNPVIKGKVNIVGSENFTKLFSSSDLGTFCHEFAHIAFTYLTPEQLDTVSVWTGVSKGILQSQKLFGKNLQSYTKAQEQFAKGFEKYLMSGRAPTPLLKDTFDRFKNWLSRIYHNSDYFDGIKVSPDMKKVYDNLLVSDAEKFGGTVEVTSFTGQKFSLDVSKVDNKACVVVKDNKGVEKNLPVDNLLRGLPLTETQRQYLGTNAVWKSPYQLTFEQMDLGITESYINESQIGDLDALPSKQLIGMAKHLGIKNPNSLTRTDLIVALRSVISIKNLNPSVPFTETSSKNSFFSENPLTTTLRAYFVPLLERVKNSGGGSPYTHMIYQKAIQVVDRVEQLEGLLNEDLINFQKKTRSSFIDESKRELVKELDEVITIQNARTTKFAGAVEYPMIYDTLSKEGKEVVDAYRELIKITGKIAEDAGLKIWRIERKEGKNGRVKLEKKEIPFKASQDGHKFLRSYTQEFWSMMTGEGAAFDKLRQDFIEHLCDLNGFKTPSERNWVATQVKNIARAADTRVMNMEVMRSFDIFPTEFTDSNGNVIPLLLTSPFFVGEILVNKFARRMAFVEIFGQNRDTILNERALFSKVANPEDYDNMIEALNGVPIFKWGNVVPGTANYKVVSCLKSIINLAKSGMLNLAVAWNVAEVAMKVPTYAGVNRTARTMGELLKDSVTWMTDKAGITTSGALEAQIALIRKYGVLTNTLTSFMIRPDPVDAFADMSTIASSLMLKYTGLTPMNSFNEFFAASTAVKFTEDLINGDGTSTDRQRLEQLRFTPEEVNTLMSSREHTSLHDALVRRLAAYTQGTHLKEVERPYFSNISGSKYLIAFDSYFRMTTMRFYELSKNVKDQMSSPNATKVDKFNAVKLWTEFVVGHGIGGLAGYGVRQLLVYGAAALGLADWDEEDDGSYDDWAKLFGEGLYYSFVGAWAEQIVRNYSKGNYYFGQNLVNSTLPGSLINNITDYAMGLNRYKDMSFLDRSTKFLSSSFAISPALAHWAFAIGMGHADPELDYATNKYYLWKQKHLPTSKSVTLNEEAETKEFRLHLKNIYEILKEEPNIKDTKDPTLVKSINDELRLAFKQTRIKDVEEKIRTGGIPVEQIAKEIKDRKQNVITYLTNRMFVGNMMMEDRIKLNKAIGDKAYLKLKSHDENIQSLIKIYKESL